MRRLAVILLVLVSLLVVAANPAEAGHGGTIHGVQTWTIDSTWVGNVNYVAQATVSVEESAGGGNVRFRLSTHCYRNGADTRCNHAANDAELRWKNCAAGSACFPPSNGSYGFRDFGTYGSNTAYALVTGGWHADTHTSYWSRALRVRVRYVDLGLLTPSVTVCSQWTEPDGYGDYLDEQCGAA
jgi:hypothetical protein